MIHAYFPLHVDASNHVEQLCDLRCTFYVMLYVKTMPANLYSVYMLKLHVILFVSITDCRRTFYINQDELLFMLLNHDALLFLERCDW